MNGLMNSPTFILELFAVLAPARHPTSDRKSPSNSQLHHVGAFFRTKTALDRFIARIKQLSLLRQPPLCFLPPTDANHPVNQHIVGIFHIASTLNSTAILAQGFDHMDGTLSDANGFPEGDIGKFQTLWRELDKSFI